MKKHGQIPLEVTSTCAAFTVNISLLNGSIIFHENSSGAPTGISFLSTHHFSIRMSIEATPISPVRFAEALKDLPLSTLHLKAAELRNSIAHLDYSNEQLQPFADGTEGGSGPDQDCLDAIKENEVVIQRMLERIALLKEEVEHRGSSWLEFQSVEELDGDKASGERLVNGTEMGHVDVEGATDGIQDGQPTEAWRDGTLQTGRIVNGEVRVDSNAPISGMSDARANVTGGRLDDEALRRAIDETMRALAQDDDHDEGMHL